MIIGGGKAAPICASRYDDEPCPKAAMHFPCGVPVCGHHLDALTAELTEMMGSRTVRTITVNRSVPAVVYYIGRPDTQTIKIGTTTHLANRFHNHQSRRGRLVLLAAEPGHYELEHARHVQFARWLVSGEKEWFYKAPEIMAHINDLRAKHGDPWLVGARHGVGRNAERAPTKPIRPAVSRPRLGAAWPTNRGPAWADTAAEVLRMAAASQPDKVIAESLGIDVGEVHLILSECAAHS